VRAAVYVRISLDKTGEELGVTRQREDAEQLITRRGWTVHAVYVDNDKSATRGRRPQWEAMVEQIEAGQIEVVVGWTLDRILRSGRDRLRMLELGKEHGITIAPVRGSEMDLSTPAGRLAADILGAVALHEVEAKGDRQRRAAQQAAENGRPPAGSVPFGFAPNRIDHHPEQAEAIRKAYTAILAGSSLAGIARRWNEQGLLSGRTRRGRVAPGTPSQWRAETVRVLLLKPRNAGLREYRGEIVGPSNAKPIVGVETWHAARAILTERAVDRVMPGGRRLLSGIAACGVCDEWIYAGGNRLGHGSYRCRSKGHVARRADHADAYIEGGVIGDEELRGVVVERLSQPDAIDLLPREDVVDIAQLRKRVRDLRARLDAVAVEFAEDETVTPQQLRTITDRLRVKLADAEAELASAGRTSVLAPLVTAEDVEHVWRRMDTAQRRAVIFELMDVTLHPTGQGARVFDPATVEIRWKTA
jgi:DNA invertase Pin-like site-specific DNA recombinase